MKKTVDRLNFIGISNSILSIHWTTRENTIIIDLVSVPPRAYTERVVKPHATKSSSLVVIPSPLCPAFFAFVLLKSGDRFSPIFLVDYRKFSVGGRDYPLQVMSSLARCEAATNGRKPVKSSHQMSVIAAS